MQLMPMLSNVAIFISFLFVIIPIFYTKTNFPHFAAYMIKMAFFSSMIASILFFSFKTPENSTPLWTWTNLGNSTLYATFLFNLPPMTFLPIALFVTWNILMFSTWYMAHDPNINLFFKYLLIFLLTMIILVSAGNLIFFFVAWEGVGIMSFLLIGWYSARADAATAALQAILYNRVGDMGLVVVICWVMLQSMAMDMMNISPKELSFLSIGLITAAASKSALFGFHPWLASAMEGPTPVSALLHSSTMVVAGIFLLIRHHHLIQQSPTALTTCLCLGAVSTAFAAVSALSQNDIKKIIAFSTSSQLGLMMVAIGINSPNLALFHMCTHAFFKAMLFLCSGVIIHTMNGQQDIRTMGGLYHIIPLTTACMTIGSLALMGTPFLTGFFSKDAIMEAASTSDINLFALLLTLIAVTLTAGYSLRLIFLTSMGYPRFSTLTLLNEHDPSVKLPLIRLALATIIMGPILYKLIVPENLVTHSMPTSTKLLALMITTLALILTYDIMNYTQQKPMENYNDFEFYNFILHRSSTYIVLNSAWNVVSHAIESILLKKLSGPHHLQHYPIKITHITQAGMIKLYLLALLLTLFLTVISIKLFMI